MVERISELREICQGTRETVYFKMPWFPKHVTRRISIYFTKLCLKIGISANQASIISLIFLIAGGVFLIFSDPRFWFIGIFLCFVYRTFDCVDGEIARYNKSSSLGGKHLDSGIGSFATPYILACMTLGTYNSLHSSTVFIFGLLAVIAVALSRILALQLLAVVHREGLFPDRVDMPSKEPGMIHFGRIAYQVFLGARGVQLLPQLLVVAAIDCFVSPFTILSLGFNARLIYLVLVALATSVGVSVKAYYDITSYGKISSGEQPQKWE